MTLPEEALKRVFTDKSLSMAAAESCTGGMLAERITDIPGSSVYFLGSVVSYDYEAKEILVGVNHDTLIEYGAVSPEVAAQMAEGIRTRLKAMVGVSITGIAGPGGGMPEKPVGLTYIGLADAQGTRTERFVWNSDRKGNRNLSVDAALKLLIEWANAQDT